LIKIEEKSKNIGYGFLILFIELICFLFVAFIMIVFTGVLYKETLALGLDTSYSM